MSNLLKSKFLFGLMIVALMLVVGVASVEAAYSHTVTLKQGSTGSQVTALQGALGVTPMSGYFGTITKAAVMAFQAANGLTADGVVGPATGAALAGGTSSGSYPAGCTSASGYSTTTGMSCAGSSSLPAGCTSTAGYSPTTGAKCSGGTTGSTAGSLGGEDGDLTDFNEVSSADSKFTEGETSELFAFEFEVDGDVEVDRVDIYMDSTAAGTHSENAEDYFDSAVLMVDGDEVATLDVDDWDEDSYANVDAVTGDSDEYRLRFTDLGLVYSDGDQPEFTLAFEVASSIDSDDLAETWGVELLTDSVRFIDGRGFSDDTGEAMEETFSGEAEDTAELTVRASSDDLDATTLEVSDTDTTDEVTVFVFELEEENGVDVTVDDLRVDVTTGASTGTTDEAAVITDAFLYNGSTLLGSESVPTGGAVTFENIGLEVDADDTVELTVKLTFADADDYTAGTDVAVTLTGNTTYIVDAEDANGNDESDMTLSGSATSETHALRTEGIIVVFDSSSYVKTSSDTTGINETVEFTLEFDVTAFGDDAFVDETCAFDDDGTYLTSQISVSLDGDADGNNTTCTDFDSSGDDAGSGFEVLEGQTEHFTVTVLGNGGEGAGAGNASTFTARINNIGYKMGTDGAGDTSYRQEMQDYKSSAVTVYDR